MQGVLLSYMPPQSCLPKYKWSPGPREGGMGGKKASRGLCKVSKDREEQDRGLGGSMQNHGSSPFEVGSWIFESLGLMMLFIFTVTPVFLCSFIVCKVFKEIPTQAQVH